MRAWIAGGLTLLAVTGAEAQVDRYSAGFYYDKVMAARPDEGHGAEKGADQKKGTGQDKGDKGAGQEKAHGAEQGPALEQATIRSYVLGYIDGYVDGRRAVSRPVCGDDRSVLRSERIEELLQARILRLKNERTNWAGRPYAAIMAELLEECPKPEAAPTPASPSPAGTPQPDRRSAGSYYDTVVKGQGREQAVAQSYVHGYVAGQVNGRTTGPQRLCRGDRSALRPDRIEELLRARILRLRNEKAGWESTSYTDLIADLVAACGKA